MGIYYNYLAYTQAQPLDPMKGCWSQLLAPIIEILLAMKMFQAISDSSTYRYTVCSCVSGDEWPSTDQPVGDHTPHSNRCREFECGKSPCSRRAAIHCTDDMVTVTVIE